ncbi:MAG: response regulator transcription factor [Chloroflexi bacterium]|jgi:DNA-binding NarL/FixJ family response regulator|nr:response regulator transcription factor [Chloroflexota bacterium]
MKPQPVRVVVVDDHILFRRGLVGLLADMGDFEVVGEANDGEEAERLIKILLPDVVLMDINMPKMNGIEVVKAIRKARIPVRILMLTISKNDADLIGAVRAGADGYLLKSSDPDELRQGLLNVYQGQGALSQEVTGTVLKALARSSEANTGSILSEREMDVLACLARGLNTQQISNQLFISENTVKTHIRHILDKLDAANRAGAVAKAVQLGIIQKDNE